MHLRWERPEEGTSERGRGRFPAIYSFFLNPWEREGGGAGSIWELRGDVEEISTRRGKKSGSFSVET